MIRFKNFILFFYSIHTFSQNIITALKVKGTYKIKLSFVEKLIKTKAGQSLDSIQLEKDIAVLKRLPAISHAYFQVFKSHQNYYNVFITISSLDSSRILILAGNSSSIVESNARFSMDKLSGST